MTETRLLPVFLPTYTSAASEALFLDPAPQDPDPGPDAELSLCDAAGGGTL